MVDIVLPRRRCIPDHLLIKRIDKPCFIDRLGLLGREARIVHQLLDRWGDSQLTVAAIR